MEELLPLYSGMNLTRSGHTGSDVSPRPPRARKRFPFRSGRRGIAADDRSRRRCLTREWSSCQWDSLDQPAFSLRSATTPGHAIIIGRAKSAPVQPTAELRVLAIQGMAGKERRPRLAVRPAILLRQHHDCAMDREGR